MSLYYIDVNNIDEKSVIDRINIEISYKYLT